MRHLVEDSTFVYHRGGVSFGEYQSEGWARSSAIIDARYPFFRPTNTHERAHDPLSVSFAALELGLHERDRERPHVLHVLAQPARRDRRDREVRRRARAGDGGRSSTSR